MQVELLMCRSFSTKSYRHFINNFHLVSYLYLLDGVRFQINTAIKETIPERISTRAYPFRD